MNTHLGEYGGHFWAPPPTDEHTPGGVRGPFLGPPPTDEHTAGGVRGPFLGPPPTDEHTPGGVRGPFLGPPPTDEHTPGGVRGPFLGPPPTDDHTSGGVRGPFLGPRYQMTIDTEAAPESQGLTVRVESFVGPLDLLLHLCRTNEVDLANLPIRAITEQYLAHLESVQFQDLETAGAFMVMAATLIYLKSKLLLPPDPDAPPDELDEEGELLRQELAERLREYARVKTLGAWLGEREAEQALLYGRTVAELPPPEDVPLEDLSVHLLERAITRLIQEQKRRTPREIEPNPLSVLERMGEVIELLRHTWSILFSSVAGAERMRAEWVVTLLALLELVRLGQARAHQGELFSEIVIESVPANEAAPSLPPPDTVAREGEPTSGD